MSSDEPPAKRQKLRIKPEKHPGFWYETGNFVLIASRKIAYRIHGDILGRKSSVFSDLLDLREVPRPESEDTMDGCPVVHITDSPEDFSTFLGIIYDGFKHHRLHAEQPRWTTVRAMMVLGDKYDVLELRAEGLRQLRVWYAEDLDEWDQRDDEFFVHENDHLSVASITSSLNEEKLHALVLYHCCRLSAPLLVLGDPDNGWPPLCAADLVRTLRYITLLPMQWSSFTRGPSGKSLVHDISKCAQCRPEQDKARGLLLDHIWNTFNTHAYMLHDISVWSPVSASLEEIICNECMLHYKSRLWKLRQYWQSRIHQHV